MEKDVSHQSDVVPTTWLKLLQGPIFLHFSSLLMSPSSSVQNTSILPPPHIPTSLSHTLSRGLSREIFRRPLYPSKRRDLTKSSDSSNLVDASGPTRTHISQQPEKHGAKRKRIVEVLQVSSVSSTSSGL